MAAGLAYKKFSYRGRGGIGKVNSHQWRLEQNAYTRLQASPGKSTPRQGRPCVNRLAMACYSRRYSYGVRDAIAYYQGGRLDEVHETSMRDLTALASEYNSSSRHTVQHHNEITLYDVLWKR